MSFEVECSACSPLAADMCGIAGAFAYGRGGSRIDRASVLRSCCRMQCRGPDGEGFWSRADERVMLGHRRLAIIDVSCRGAQPMTSDDGRLTVVFNGEIYNYRELRRELEQRGRRFHSTSDTEVLLHLYAEHGEAMLERLRGMFALAIWDETRSGLLIARDCFGIKPLYLANDGKIFRFASEVKALIRGGGVDTGPEPAGHAGFFLWGHVPDPFTFYRGIRSLPAGCSLWCPIDGPAVISEFASPTRILAAAERAEDSARPSDALGDLHAAIRESIAYHLVADVDVGVFLSAGIDSTVLAALVAETGLRPRTVTLGFREYSGTTDEETRVAELVARRYGCDHNTVWVTHDDFDAELPRFLDRMDQPTTDGVNTYFVARAAARFGLKVALSGLGGDELFGGYPSFHQLPRVVNALRWIPAANHVGRFARSMVPAAVSRLSPKYAGIIEYGHDFPGAYILRRSMFAPWEITNLIEPEMARAGLATLASRANLGDTIHGLSSSHFRVSALEATWYMRNQLLRDADWTSMSHGVEVRVPYLDATLWRSAAPLTRAGRVSGKEALALAPVKSLPDAVVQRTKTGFTTPMATWASGTAGARSERGLRGWARRVYAAQLGLA